MKYLFAPVLLLILLSGCTQEKDASEKQTRSNQKTGHFLLVPQPQQFEIQGVSRLASGDLKRYYLSGDEDLHGKGTILDQMRRTSSEGRAQIVCKTDPLLDLPVEGYSLALVEDQVVITGVDPAGLFYGLKTLGQLMKDADDQGVNLPSCRIEDYPLLSYRAIHLDVKHHLDRLDYYYELMDFLAGYKINAIIAEVEDKIRYELQPAVGSPDALTIEEWRALSDYAQERHIEISPLVQGLGHASFILKHEGYESLRDDPGSDWAFNPLNPETYEVQFDLYRDALKAFPHAKYLHVGGDEVHTTGRGSGQSPLELQMIWLNKVCDFAEEQGRTPIFWDDMPLKHAGIYHSLHNREMTEEAVDDLWKENEHKLLEFLDEFPTNCIYMRWNYGAPQAIGNSRAMAWFREHNLKVMGATAGQCRWVLMPQDGGNLANIKYFATSSIETGMHGLLLTLWDDDSPHFELYKRGILGFAEYTWSGDQRSLDEFRTAYRQREFGFDLASPEYAFIDRLEAPVIFWKNALLKGNQRNYLAGIEDPLERVIDLPDPDQPGHWSEAHAGRLELAHRYASLCDSIGQQIEEMKELANRNVYTLEVYEQVNVLVDFTMEALLLLEEFDRESGSGNRESEKVWGKVKGLAEKFEGLRNEFEKVYAKTRILNKPDGYILDQDHHVHLANQTRTFDWQFYAEMLFLQKVTRELLKE